MLFCSCFILGFRKFSTPSNNYGRYFCCGRSTGLAFARNFALPLTADFGRGGRIWKGFWAGRLLPMHATQVSELQQHIYFISTLYASLMLLFLLIGPIESSAYYAGWYVTILKKRSPHTLESVCVSHSDQLYSIQKQFAKKHQFVKIVKRAPLAYTFPYKQLTNLPHCYGKVNSTIAS